jgi:hypothetical protein
MLTAAALAAAGAAAAVHLTLVTAVREVQIPVLASMLLGGCATKLIATLRAGGADPGLGPTALFPMRLRRTLAILVGGLECGLGAGLIVTAGPLGRGAPAISVRLGTALLFLVGVCALLELRTNRPDVGCGCFGDFSTAPVSERAMARSALLALAALATIGMPPLQLPRASGSAELLLGIFVAELIVIAALSPELAEALVTLGYSEPCELRMLPVERTLTALRRSAQWRRHAGLMTSDVPVDTWRELCWRYVVFPGRHDGRDAELVFAVYQRQRRPAVLAALVDAVTCELIPWPGAPGGPGRRISPARRPGGSAGAGPDQVLEHSHAPQGMQPVR